MTIQENNSVYNKFLINFNITNLKATQDLIQGEFTPRIASGFIEGDSIIFIQGLNEQRIISKVSKISLLDFESVESTSLFHTYSYSSALSSSGLLVFGGREPKLTNRLVLYSGDPLTTVVVAKDFYGPSGRLYSVFTVNEEKIYIFGGYDNGSNLNDMWAFDIEDNIWTEIKMTGWIPSVRQKPAYCAEGSYIFLFGGKNIELLTDLYYFSTSNFKWSILAEGLESRPSPRSGACMVFYDAKLFIYGGATSSGSSNEMWRFDLYKEEFSLVSKSELALEHNKCFIEDDFMVIVSYNHSSKYLQFFNLVTFGWEERVKLDFSFYGSIDFYMTKKLITMGGTRANSILSNKLEVFDLDTFEKDEMNIEIYSYFSSILYYQQFLYIFSGNSFSSMVGISSSSNLLIKVNISDIISSSKCSKGTYTDLIQNKCTACSPGSYSSSPGSTKCTPCPAGTYSKSCSANSIQQCKPCKTSTWNNMTGQAYCRDCPWNSYCPYGSISPVSLPSETKFESIQPGSYSADTNLYNYSSNLLIYMSVAGIFLLICSFLISKTFRDKIHIIDIYTSKHNHKVMVPMYIKQTTLGGLCTILFVIGAINFIAISVMNFYMVNLIETRTLVPLITISGSTVIDADLSIQIDFRFYGGNCDSNYLSTNIKGISGNFVFETIRDEHKCIVAVSCPSCTVNDYSEILVSFKEQNSFATEIDLNFTSTTSIPGKTSSVRTLVLSDSDKILTGNTSSVFQFELTPTLMNDQSATTSGYHINGNISPVIGSQYEEIELFYSSQVSVLIKISVASTCLNISRDSALGLLDLFSALIGTVFGLLSSVGGILRVTEKHFDNFSSWFQHKNMLNYYRARINKLMRIIHTDCENISSKSTSDVMSFSIYDKSFTEIEKTYLKH